MDQLEIGMFIAKKRKERNFTQAQLAEKLGVSNKTISKWETGKCMPDYGIIQSLCKELEITVSELIDGEETEPDSIRVYDDNQVLDLIKRIQKSGESESITVRYYFNDHGDCSFCGPFLYRRK